MIEVRYSLNEAIDILGTQKDIEEFRQEVLKFLKSDLKEIHIEVKKILSLSLGILMLMIYD